MFILCGFVLFSVLFLNLVILYACEFSCVGCVFVVMNVLSCSEEDQRVGSARTQWAGVDQ